jgi:TonB family protein
MSGSAGSPDRPRSVRGSKLSADMASTALVSRSPNGSASLLPAFLILMGCVAQQAIERADSPRTGSVAMQAVSADDSQPYEVATNETWFAPAPMGDHVAPVYPEELLAQKLPAATVRVRLIVDNNGVVTDSTALEAPPNYPQFFAAVQVAVRQWTYSPLVRSVPGEGDTALHFNGWSATYSGKATAMPFHQDYDIVFTQKDGQGVAKSVTPAAAPK